MPDLRKDCVVRGLNENIIPLNKCKIENKLCSEGRLDEGYLTYTAGSTLLNIFLEKEGKSPVLS